MAFEVTVEHKQSLQEDGIVKLPGLIDDVLLDELNRCFGWSVAHPGPIAAGSPEGDNVFFVDNANPEARPMYRNPVSNSPFGRIAAELWGSEYVGYYAEEVFWKTGRSMATFWHQDTVYSPWGGEHWGNFWIPLVEMNAEYAIRVVRGSHQGIMYDGTTFNPKDPTDPLWGDAGDFPRLPDISADIEKDPTSWDVAGFDVEPGDVVVLHPHCLHIGGGADENLPERKNLVLRFFGDKSFFSDHLPKTKDRGLYDHEPIPATSGGYLQDGDPYRPEGTLQANAV